VNEIETKLRASTNALEEAQAQIDAAEAKYKQELETAVKEPKAQVSKAEEALSKNETDQATREEKVRLCLEKLSNSFGGKYRRDCYTFSFVFIYTDILNR
jgi:exonuclease VII large subunit